MNANETYPTKWQLGKPRGSIKEQPTAYLLVMSPPNGKQVNEYFLHRVYKSKELAYAAACARRLELSDQYGTTRNKIRYLDKDTIEVQLTQDQVMKTDAKFLEQVEKFPINVKSKKVKNGINYYATCQDKKVSFLFTDLICNYKIVEYINGNTLDVTSKNIKEFGSVTKQIEIEDNIIGDQYKYFNMEIDKLPKNIWLLGKPAGTIFKRTGENIYTVRVNNNDNKQHTKTFNVSEFKDDKEAYEKAREWQIETSYKINETKNLIRIINDKTIEVQLTQDKIMKTDKIFIPVIQLITIFNSKSGSGIDYATFMVDRDQMKYHTLITGFSMTDHINGDSLDNRLDNLRSVSVSMNNSNRHDDESLKLGVRREITTFGDVYKASIKLEGYQYYKNFSINKYGENKAKELATEFRKKLLLISDIDSEITENDDPQLIECLITKTKYMLDHTMMNTVYEKNKYLQDIQITDDLRKKLFDYYFTHQMTYYRDILVSHEKLKELHLTKLIY